VKFQISSEMLSALKYQIQLSGLNKLELRGGNFTGAIECSVIDKLRTVLCVAEYAGAGGREIQIRRVL
jgi:hypothetical protein